MGTTCCWWRADIYLTRQEMHLGDGGCIPMQTCKLHSRCTIAEVTCQGQAQAGQARTVQTGLSQHLSTHGSSGLRMKPLPEAALLLYPQGCPQTPHSPQVGAVVDNSGPHLYSRLMTQMQKAGVDGVRIKTCSALWLQHGAHGASDAAAWTKCLAAEVKQA